MDENTENNIPIKEVIFNKKKYSITKIIIFIFYAVLLYYSQITNNEGFGFTLTFIGTIAGIIYFIGKLYFYNTKRKIKDIIFLIIFIGLLFWGIYTFYTL